MHKHAIQHSTPQTKGRIDGYLMMLIILAAGTVSFFWGEKIPFDIVKQHKWDGSRYVALAKDFHGQVIRKGMAPHRLQRTLPSAIVHVVLRVLNLPRQDRVILKVFELYNLALLVLSALIWARLSQGFPRARRWLGFFALFVNYAVLKFGFYYPALTDISALFLGMLMLLFFLRGRRWGILLTAILGAFTWPTTLVFGLLLYLFPRQHTPLIETKRTAAACVATGTSLVILSGIIFVHYLRDIPPANEAAPVLKPLLPISSFFVVGYVFYCLATILNTHQLWSVRALRRLITARHVLAAAAIFIALSLAVNYMADHQEMQQRLEEYRKVGAPAGVLRYLPPMLMIYVGRTVQLATTKPLVFLVAHAVFYGPIIFLVVFCWRAFSRAVRKDGIGVTIFVSGYIFLSINSESRVLIFFYPFLVYYAIVATQGRKWGLFAYLFFALTSLLFSKVWLKINAEPFTGEYLSFPFQRHFMNHGPWMSNETYIVQGVVVLLCGGLFYVLLARRGSRNGMVGMLEKQRKSV